jgi:hypothetical protein
MASRCPGSWLWDNENGAASRIRFFSLSLRRAHCGWTFGSNASLDVTRLGVETQTQSGSGAMSYAKWVTFSRDYIRPVATWHRGAKVDFCLSSWTRFEAPGKAFSPLSYPSLL